MEGPWVPRGSPGSFSKYFGHAAASSTMNLSEAGGSISHGSSGAECVQGRENPSMSFGELVSKIEPGPRGPWV